MIKPCRKTLKAINYLCQNSDSTSSIDIIVYYHNRVNNLDLNNTLQYLLDNGYINVNNTDGTWTEITPTYTGIHYSDFSKEKFKNFILTSLLVPIVVSIITSLITLWINSL